MPQNRASNTVFDITDKVMGGKANAKKPFRMAAKDGVGEIFIYDSIGGGFFEEGVTAKGFAEDLKALGDIRTLNVFMNTPGGSVFEDSRYIQRGGDVRYAPGDCPVAEDLFAREVSIPLNEWYDAEDCANIAAGINKVLDAYCTPDSEAGPWQ